MTKTEQMELATKAMVEALEGLGEKFLQGMAEDVTAFATELAADLVLAKQEGREDLVAEIQGQVRALAEAHRLEAHGLSWDALEVVVGVVAQAAVTAVGGAL